jgi:hypothetical protein
MGLNFERTNVAPLQNPKWGIWNSRNSGMESRFGVASRQILLLCAYAGNQCSGEWKFGQNGSVRREIFVGRGAQRDRRGACPTQNLCVHPQRFNAVALEIRRKKLLRVIPRSDTEQHVRVYCHV